MNVTRSSINPTLRIAACAATMIALLGPAPAAWAQAGGNKADKLMTREELRACLKQKDAQKGVVDDLVRSRTTLDTEKAGIAKERETLDEQVKAVGAERDTVDKADEAAVKAYNDKVNAAIATVNTRRSEIDAKVDGWNAKNRALADRAQAHDASMKNYNDTCASRRFREDDEKAIRAGK